MRRASPSLVLALGLLALVHCGDDASPSPSYGAFPQAGGGGGAGGAAGASSCAPVGQQVACACPGAVGQAQGVQVCQADGTLGACTGCPPSAGGAGGAGAGGGAGGSGKAGGGGSAGQLGQAGAGGPAGSGGWSGSSGASGQAGTAGQSSSTGGFNGQGGTTDKCSDDCSIYKTPPESAALPPPPDPAAPAGNGGDAAFAFRRVYLGETDWDGDVSADAWKQYGFDLDGYSSDIGFGGHCKAIAGGKKADIRLDGQGGIDNSFGKNVLPVFQTFTSSPTELVDGSIDMGKATHVLVVHGLGQGSSYAGLSVDFFGPSTGSGVAPTEAQWSAGTTAWHPQPALLSSPSPPSALSPFSQSYLSGDTLVMKGSDVVPLSLFGALVTFHLRSPLASIKLSPDHKGGAKGVLAGYLVTDELVADAAIWGPRLTPSLCDSGAQSAIANALEAASDSLKAGTQDPTRNCDAVSFGMGFDLQVATVASPVAPDFGPDPCTQP